jgi:hypothetical protein
VLGLKYKHNPITNAETPFTSASFSSDSGEVIYVQQDVFHYSHKVREIER